MCNVYPIFGDLRQFLLSISLTSEVLPPNLQLYTSSFVFTCRFYKVFGRYLLCCVRIGLDWIQILGHRLDWTGLGSVARGFGLDWIVSTRSIPYSGSNSGIDPSNSDGGGQGRNFRYISLGGPEPLNVDLSPPNDGLIPPMLARKESNLKRNPIQSGF